MPAELGYGFRDKLRLITVLENIDEANAAQGTRWLYSRYYESIDSKGRSKGRADGSASKVLTHKR